MGDARHSTSRANAKHDAETVDGPATGRPAPVSAPAGFLGAERSPPVRDRSVGQVVVSSIDVRFATLSYSGTRAARRCVTGPRHRTLRKGFLVKDLIKRFVREEEGATMVEYGLMVALIAVVSILAVTSLGDGVFDAFSATATAVDGAETAPQVPATPAD